MISATYRAQFELLLKILPYVAREDIFALTGGTAINLFVRDLPRLSVDIELKLSNLQKLIKEKPDKHRSMMLKLEEVLKKY